MAIKINSIAYHRNGVCGEGFHAVLFKCPDNGEMVATVFDEAGQCAVLQLAGLAAGTVAFGENSWRGDHYEDELRAAISARYPHRAAAA